MKSSSKFLIGFIAGAAAGAIAGILLAPDKGSETRKKVAEKAKKLKTDFEKGFSGQVDDLKEYFRNSVDPTKAKTKKEGKKSGKTADQATGESI